MQLVGDGLRDLAAARPRDQLDRVVAAEAAERQLLDPGRLELPRLAHARCEHDRDPLVLEASRREHERLRRALVEPMRVVDEAKERRVLRRRREQAERRRSDQEPVGVDRRGDPEGATQRCRLPLGDVV